VVIFSNRKPPKSVGFNDPTGTVKPPDLGGFEGLREYGVNWTRAICWEISMFFWITSK